MAIYYGGTSKYLLFLSKKFFIWFILGIAFFLAFAVRLSEVAQYNQYIVLFLLFVTVGAFLFVAGKYTVRNKKLSFGRVGEWTVKEELLKLPDSYHVFQDIVLGKGNIDFVVIGPSGIYAIEAKSHSGKISFDGISLLRNGKYFEKDFLAQTTYEVMDLKRFLESQLHRSIFVKAVLVFAGKSFVSTGFAPIKGVHVISSSSLLKLIEYSQSLDPSTISQVVEALKIKVA